tara:strand:- start:356 stop:1177 length:822 start_codon:yes stop_codon:yes gene_type:complete
MRYIFTIILILILSQFVIGQSTVQFEIEEIFINDSSDFKSSTDFERLDSAFFQDEDYYVRRTCHGEFGGSIWFRNKKTGIEYSCAATCPVIVNKIKNKYIVTTSLSHFQGFSSVFEIENPDSMDVFQKPELERVISKWGWKKRRFTKWGFRKVFYANSAGDLESKSRKGSNSLLDTAGVTILLSFPYKEHLYHIVSDSKTLYLSKLENNMLTTIDTIYVGLDNFHKVDNEIRYIYSTKGFETKDNHHIVLFENSGLVGFLDIHDNKIKLTRYQ